MKKIFEQDYAVTTIEAVSIRSSNALANGIRDTVSQLVMGNVVKEVACVLVDSDLVFWLDPVALVRVDGYTVSNGAFLPVIEVRGRLAQGLGVDGDRIATISYHPHFDEDSNLTDLSWGTIGVDRDFSDPDPGKPLDADQAKVFKEYEAALTHPIGPENAFSLTRDDLLVVRDLLHDAYGYYL